MATWIVLLRGVNVGGQLERRQQHLVQPFGVVTELLHQSAGRRRLRVNQPSTMDVLPQLALEVVERFAFHGQGMGRHFTPMQHHRPPLFPIVEIFDQRTARRQHVAQPRHRDFRRLQAPCDLGLQEQLLGQPLDLPLTVAQFGTRNGDPLARAIFGRCEPLSIILQDMVSRALLLQLFEQLFALWVIFRPTPIFRRCHPIQPPLPLFPLKGFQRQPPFVALKHQPHQPLQRLFLIQHEERMEREGELTSHATNSGVGRAVAPFGVVDSPLLFGDAAQKQMGTVAQIDHVAPFGGLQQPEGGAAGGGQLAKRKLTFGNDA